jgi:hypothetical protein
MGGDILKNNVINVKFGKENNIDKYIKELEEIRIRSEYRLKERQKKSDELDEKLKETKFDKIKRILNTKIF